jgi:RNA binding exosome subunit
MNKYIVVNETEDWREIATKHVDSDGAFYIRFDEEERALNGKWKHIAQFSISAESLMNATKLLDDEIVNNLPLINPDE